MAEQLPLKQFVEGSSPPGVTINRSDTLYQTYLFNICFSSTKDIFINTVEEIQNLIHQGLNLRLCHRSGRGR